MMNLKRGDPIPLKTNSIYSDGDFIEIFLQFRSDKIRISDLGETARHFVVYDLDWSNHLETITDISKSFDVVVKDGMLFIDIADPKELPKSTKLLLNCIEAIDEWVTDGVYDVALAGELELAA